MNSMIRFGIITPTYRRKLLLKLFIRNVRSQSYPSWDLCIVHDGEDEAIRCMVNEYAARDPRLHYLETPNRANNFGVTPRLLGMTQGFSGRGCDYLVFWDDDNYFYHNALRNIARSLSAANYPDVLLVPIYYGDRILPADKPASALEKAELDAANLVVRYDLACQHYQTVGERCKSGAVAYNQDFFLFEEVRRAIPPQSIAVAHIKPIAFYDGMQRAIRFRHIRRTWNLPQLNLNRIPWYRDYVARTWKGN